MAKPRHAAEAGAILTSAFRTWPLALALLLPACTVGPRFTPPQPRAMPAGWTPASLAPPPYAASAATQGTVEAAWWRQFNDPTLSWLVEEVERGNPEIDEAAARIAETRQQRAITLAGFWPTLDANASDTRLRISENSPFAALAGGRPSAGGQPNPRQGAAIPTGPKSGLAIYQLGFDAAWEPDIWGRTRRGVEAAEADILSAGEARANALLSLRAEAARGYLELRDLQARREIARRSLALQRDTARLTRSRARSGFATDLDVANADAQVAGTEATLPQFDAQVTQAQNRLARLVGQLPGALAARLETREPLPPVPPAVGIGLPMEIIRRRPDIRGAEAALAAQTARIGVATAQLYPNLRINGSLGLQSGNTVNLFSTASRFFSIGPSLIIPIFEGGRLRAQIRLEEARARTAALAWQRTVLDALHEVENALAGYYGAQGRLAALQRQTRAARQAAQIARQRFSAGLGTFLDVLDAERTRLQAELTEAEAGAQVATGLVAVYKALGGGWEPAG